MLPPGRDGEHNGPMRHTVVLAPDSFKESLTAKQVCEALERGMRQVLPEADFVHVPMADGGEGTVQSLVDATGGQFVTTTVDGPLGDPVEATWGMLGDSSTAVIEMAEASGIGLVAAAERDPRRASTCGTGQLVAAALDRGARTILVGIGGSATNDGGAGMAQALGARLLDAEGQELEPGGAALARLERIDLSGLDRRLAAASFVVACDVTNPLCGPDGASAVYGPQKGADEQCVAELDAALAHWGRLLEQDFGAGIVERPGAGAAGGLGAGLVAFCGADLRRGVEIVIEHSGLAEAVQGASLVVTGEGRMDSQTRFGKTPKGVADVAVAAGVPVVAVCGSLGSGVETLYEEGFDAIFPVIGRLSSLDEALEEAGGNVERTARAVAATLRLGAQALS